VTSEYNSLVVKPAQWSVSLGNYSDIVVTGKQIGLGVSCFDFAIHEQLDISESGVITSNMWKGYYTYNKQEYCKTSREKDAPYSEL
jgi:hypothetical protein